MKKSDNTTVIIIGVVCVCVVILGIGGYFWYKQDEDVSGSSYSSATVVPVVPIVPIISLVSPVIPGSSSSSLLSVIPGSSSSSLLSVIPGSSSSSLLSVIPGSSSSSNLTTDLFGGRGLPDENDFTDEKIFENLLYRKQPITTNFYGLGNKFDTNINIIDAKTDKFIKHDGGDGDKVKLMDRGHTYKIKNDENGELKIMENNDEQRRFTVNINEVYHLKDGNGGDVVEFYGNGLGNGLIKLGGKWICNVNNEVTLKDEPNTIWVIKRV
jgi:hypothetical protein